MLSILKTELIKNLKKDVRVFMLMILTFTSLFIVSILSITNYIDSKERLKDYKEAYLDSTYYNLYPKSEGEGDTFNGVKLESLVGCYNDISKNFKYDDSYNHPIFIESSAFKGSEKFLEGYENGRGNSEEEYIGLKAYRVGKYFDELDKPKMAKGNYFYDGDFIYKKDEELPIILGNEYMDIYDLGEELEFEYDGMKRGRVVGFLDKGSFILDDNKKEILDRYVIVPSYDCENLSDISKEEKANLLWHYQLKLLGRLVINKDKVSEKSDFENKLYEYGIYNVILYNKTESAEKNYYEQKESSYQMIALSATILLFTIIALIMFMISRIYSNSKKYSIYILLGFKDKFIMKLILVETIFIYIISMVLSSGFLLVLYVKGVAPYIFNIGVWGVIFIIVLVLITLSWIISFVELKKINVVSTLRRGD